jgi:hypothetical protein
LFTLDVRKQKQLKLLYDETKLLYDETTKQEEEDGDNDHFSTRAVYYVV